MSLKLLDRFGTIVGEISITEDKTMAMGEFIPTHEFLIYESIFKDHEQAANNQLLVEVDRLEREIELLCFYIIDSNSQIKRNITDLQIMDMGITFRWA